MIGLVGRVEFQYGKVFAGKAEGSDSLPTVDVEAPYRFAKYSSDSGEEVGEGGASVEIADDVAACILLWGGDVRFFGSRTVENELTIC